MMRFFIIFLFPVAAVAEELLVDAMSTSANWALTGQRVSYTLGKSKLEAVKEPARPGAKAVLKLTYDLDRRYWVGLQWRGGPMSGRVQVVSFWMYGDESKHQLLARFEDANGRIYEARLGLIDWKDWRKVDVPIDETKWRPVLRYAEERIPVRWPVALREIRIAKVGKEPLLGEVLFSDLRATTRVSPIDRVTITVSTTAPANTFYLPEPAVFQAVFENPNTTEIKGLLEVEVCDWLERPIGAPQTCGEIILPAGGKAERELRVPMSAIGSFKAWVRLRVGEACREATKRFAISRRVTEPAKLDPDSPFGMGLYLPRFRKDDELRQAIQLAREAGVKWTRHGLSIAWLQPSPGRWAWEGPRWIAGHRGGAVELGVGQPFVVQDAASLDSPCKTGELTLSFWIKFLRFDYTDRWRTLLGKGQGPQRQFYIFYTVSTRQLGISFGDGASGWSDIACSKSDWKVGQWYHVVVAHRRADRSVRWWVDGAPAGSGEARFPNTLYQNDLPLEIGWGLECGLDDFAIYDKAMSPEHLKEVKPVAHWTFDEGSGQRAADISGNENHAEIRPFRHDLIFEQARSAGILSYVVLSGTPKWMASKPTEDLERPWNIMPQLDKWSEAVQNIVVRYKEHGIRVWEIWNEPNILSFWSPEPNAKEYYAVLAASYAAIKKADAQATVLGCSLAGPHGPTHRPPYEFVEEVLKLGGGNVMDAISIHPYRQPRSPEESDYLGDLKAISDLTAKYGKRLPIWITEVGWSNDVGGVSEAWAAKMLLRAYLLAVAAGVKNITWYDYHDDGEDPSYNEHHFGVLLYDLTPKPAYFAFRTMATELAGMRFEREVPAGKNATVLLFSKGDRQCAVVWSHRKETFLALRGFGGVKEMVSLDLMGNPQTYSIRDGALLLTLGEDALFLRDVPATMAAVRPIACEPAVLKLLPGESGKLSVTLHNPFDKPLAVSTPGHTLELGPGEQKVVELGVSYEQVASWSPPVWRSPDGQVQLQVPARVVAVRGQREPIFQKMEEVNEPCTIAHTPSLQATDEVTISCRLRSEGPTDTWQVPVAKWEGDVVRNYGLYLGREKGELCFSASFEKGTFRHTDLSSGVSLFDGKWHRVVVTYSKHDAEVCFYIDGALVKRLPYDGGELKPTTAPLRILHGFGMTENGKTKQRGAIRDIRIWNRALSAEEILK